MPSLLLSPTRRRALGLLTALLVGAGGGTAAALAVAGHGTTTKVVTVPGGTGHTRVVSAPASSPTVSSIYRQVKRGVVDITVRVPSSNPFVPAGATAQAEGSGFVIDKQGDIVTNQHVVSGASSIEVRFSDGTKASAQLVGADSATDVAVIRVSVDPSQLQPLAFGDSSRVQVGDGVIAIGSPFGLAGSVTSGVVSGVGRTVPSPSGNAIHGAIQTDAPINPGNSGGPLLDSAGQVIGINQQIASTSGDSSGVGFAIPSNTASRVGAQILGGNGV
jgi:S1-C subfamily serine protease